MSSPILWIVAATLFSALFSALTVLSVRALRESPADEPSTTTDDASPEPELRMRPLVAEPLYVLLVDDDPNLRALLRTSFEIADLEVAEADSAKAAATSIADRHPDVIVLDVGMPGVNGLVLCRGLKADPYTRDIPICLLTGDAISEAAGRDAGADAFLRKPFSPLALLQAIEELGVGKREGAPDYEPDGGQQLLLYAQDFRRLLELERGQRVLLQNAYRETVVALARAIESKDGATGAHSERVRLYAKELAKALSPSLLEEPSLEYGFILHDIGKIGIPDRVLGKRAALTDTERRLIETHTVLGEQMVGDAALLRGPGASVVRSHHERWDGSGYPDRLSGEGIPIGARIFAVADALDAITSNRPYRPAKPWEDAAAEIAGQAGSQFDPRVVQAFQEREGALRQFYLEFNTN
ncbi:MAG TPA: HD domain-containing phosphohydrolase [Gaiellaceae bacterium]|jgi:ribonuclease P protein subunit RPR2